MTFKIVRADGSRIYISGGVLPERLSCRRLSKNKAYVQKSKMMRQLPKRAINKNKDKKTGINGRL